MGKVILGGHRIYSGHKHETCGICHYHNVLNMECRRRSPSFDGWPKVSKKDYCGDWTERSGLWEEYLEASDMLRNELKWQEFLEEKYGE